MVQYHILKKKVKTELKIARVNYEEKVENMFRSNNSRPGWEGVRSTMGMLTKKTEIAFNSLSDYELSEDLDHFFLLF